MSSRIKSLSKHSSRTERIQRSANAFGAPNGVWMIYAGRTGLQAQNHEDHADFRAYLAGLIGHVTAASAAQGARLREALWQIRQ